MSHEAINLGISILCDVLQNEIMNYLKKKKFEKKRIWVRKWVKRRSSLGFSNTFIEEVRIEDPKTFKNFLRMSPDKFDELLSLVESSIIKQNTFFRDSISPKTKLEIVLRYLATGDSFGSLEAGYRVPKSTISKFLIPVLKSICDSLKTYIEVPHSEDNWRKIADGFLSRWNFPNCCGAIDGKHIRIQCPPFSHSDFYNYKGFFSIILFAMVNSNYEFVYVDIGRNGRINDSTIFRESTLKASIENGNLNFPKWGIIVGDDAFPLSTYLLKPYSHHGALSNDERIFNYRLSRARRVVENAFGILSSRFRILLRPINLNPDKVDYIVRACCLLHNWLRQTNTQAYFPPGCVDREDIENGEIIPGEWRKEIENLELFSLSSTTSRNSTKDAITIRNNYKHYFTTTGAVDWQQNFIK